MSLASLLLGGGSSSKAKQTSNQIIDTDLDALFRSNNAALSQTISSISTASHPIDHKKKRKSRAVEDNNGDGEVVESHQEKKRKKKVMFAEDEGVVLPASNAKLQKYSKDKKERGDGRSKKKSKKHLQERVEEPMVSNAAYHDPLERNGPAHDDSDASNGDNDPSRLVHESIAKTPKTVKVASTKSKFVPPDETAEQRDARTIFVGNLSVEVAAKRPLLKQLHRHILSRVPNAKIESTRFRSIAFQTPTSQLPNSDGEEAVTKAKNPAPKPDNPTSQKARQHDRDRTASWRAEQETAEIKADDKRFLNPNQKKKIAFINHDFHSGADTINAYIVFSHPPPAAARAANLPPLPSILDPHEAARQAVAKCDGTIFMERMIRVDLAKPSDDHSVGIDNPKLSVFVGNLDFGCKEEDLRMFFEGVVSGERGPPEVHDGEDDDVEPTTWVTRVRVVRDKETQLGKGFAYVQFSDRECVDELLAMEKGKLKFAKRKLRLQRCKTLPGGSSNKRSIVPGDSTSPPTPRTRGPPVPIPIPSIPKGDPSLGGKLAHLSKDKRKEIKSADADRVARRLAKKKARNALEKQGLKALRKDRERVRKSTAVGKGSTARKVVSKMRIRSEKSMAKRNLKK